MQCNIYLFRIIKSEVLVALHHREIVSRIVGCNGRRAARHLVKDLVRNVALHDRLLRGEDLQRRADNRGAQLLRRGGKERLRG